MHFLLKLGSPSSLSYYQDRSRRSPGLVFGVRTAKRTRKTFKGDRSLQLFILCASALTLSHCQARSRRSPGGVFGVRTAKRTRKTFKRDHTSLFFPSAIASYNCLSYVRSPYTLSHCQARIKRSPGGVFGVRTAKRTRKTFKGVRTSLFFPSAIAAYNCLSYVRSPYTLSYCQARSRRAPFIWMRLSQFCSI